MQEFTRLQIQDAAFPQDIKDRSQDLYEVI